MVQFLWTNEIIMVTFTIVVVIVWKRLGSTAEAISQIGLCIHYLKQSHGLVVMVFSREKSRIQTQWLRETNVIKWFFVATRLACIRCGMIDTRHFIILMWHIGVDIWKIKNNNYICSTNELKECIVFISFPIYSGSSDNELWNGDHYRRRT